MIKGQFQMNGRHNGRPWFESDAEGWFYRAADAKDPPLVRGARDAFIKNGRVHVKGRDLADRLDRGLMLPKME